MGILSIAKKAISLGRRALNVAPEFLLGDSSEVIGKAMRNKKGSIFSKAKAGAKALEADIAAKKAAQGGFAKRVINNLKPKFYINQIKNGANAAKTAGKSSLWGGIKGLGKGIAKKMPFIGAALTVLFEAPNLYTAFKEGGFSAGMKEVGGATVELGCMAAGAAIGSAICPGVGTIIGGIVGAIGGSLLRGKTYTEKKAEQEAIAQLPKYTKEDIAKLQEYGFTPEEIEQFRQNGYKMEDIRKAIDEELKLENQTPVTTPQDNTRVEKPAIPEKIPEAQGYETPVQETNNESSKISQQMIDEQNKAYQEELKRLQEEFNFNPQPQQSFNPLGSMYQMPFMSYGITNPFMSGMNNSLGGYNPYMGSLLQMPYSNPFIFNPQNQYFRYSA